MTSSFGQCGNTAGNTPAVAAMGAARKSITSEMGEVPPTGAAGEVLDVVSQVWEDMEQAQLAMLLRLAQLEAAGTLLEAGGQRSVQNWLIHSAGMVPVEANGRAELARRLFARELPAIREGLDSGLLSIGEAVAVCRAAERAVVARNTGTHPDAGTFRLMMEAGIMAAKAKKPTMSTSDIAQLGRELLAQYNPSAVEEQYQAAFDARGARLAHTFDATFLFELWGPVEHAEEVKRELKAYEVDYDPERLHVSVSERMYDAFMNLVRSATNPTTPTDPTGNGEGAEGAGTGDGKGTGGQGGTGGTGRKRAAVAMINIMVPLPTFLGLQDEGAGPAMTQDGQVFSMAAIRALAPNSVLRRLITSPKGETVLDVGRAQRNATGALRDAGMFGHTTCAWYQGCNTPASASEADHKRSFSAGGTTSADNIQPLCSDHNRLKYRRETNPDQPVWQGRPSHRNRNNKDQSGGKGSDGDPDPAQPPSRSHTHPYF
ncbi:HNH endonuclease signature motif containing protein [Nocardiopsis oceani]